MVPDPVMDREVTVATTERSSADEHPRARANGDGSETARRVDDEGVAGPGFMEEMWRGSSEIPVPAP